MNIGGLLNQVMKFFDAFFPGVEPIIFIQIGNEQDLRSWRKLHLIYIPEVLVSWRL